VRLLERGECVAVFPEGQDSRGGVMRRGYPGPGMLALRLGVPVVPAAIWDTQLFRGPARMVFGPPIDLSGVPPGPLADTGGPVQEPPLGAPPPVALGAPLS
jgi:1-acyl-sn-glycerol-3-phosphate acyltransferase